MFNLINGSINSEPVRAVIIVIRREQSVSERVIIFFYLVFSAENNFSVELTKTLRKV